MLEYVASILIILVTLAFIFLYYLPRKRYYWHAKTYSDLGYKVKVYDYKPFNVGLVGIEQEWYK